MQRTGQFPMSDRRSKRPPPGLDAVPPAPVAIAAPDAAAPIAQFADAPEAVEEPGPAEPTAVEPAPVAVAPEPAESLFAAPVQEPVAPPLLPTTGPEPLDDPFEIGRTAMTAFAES